MGSGKQFFKRRNTLFGFVGVETEVANGVKVLIGNVNDKPSDEAKDVLGDHLSTKIGGVIFGFMVVLMRIIAPGELMS